MINKIDEIIRSGFLLKNDKDEPGKINLDDPFALMGVDLVYDIDPEVLEDNYFRLQQTLHPDRFVNKPGEERKMAEVTSAAVNKAFAILKDPLGRAKALLDLKVVSLINEDQELHNLLSGQPVGMAILEEAMLWRQKSMQAEGEDALKSFESGLKQTIHEAEHLFKKFMENNDLKNAQQQYLRMVYLVKALP